MVRRLVKAITELRDIRHFRRNCTRLGVGVRGGGPVFIENDGTLIIGDNFGMRSRRHNMIEFWVGRHARLTIGNNVGMNQGTRIGCSQHISIGDGCIIGDECVIIDSDFHPVDHVITKSGPVRIEPYVWLASRVMVLQGVTIGTGSVIAAGAVVTRSIPANVLAGGVPARVIRPLEDQTPPSPTPPSDPQATP